MLPVVAAGVNAYIKKKAKRSKGIMHLFWGLLLLVSTVVPIAGYDQTLSMLKQLTGAISDKAPQLEAALMAHAPGSGPLRVYFTRPDLPPNQSEITKALVGYIDKTKQTLDICCFELNNKVITEAIVQAVRRGVKVRFVTETNYLDDPGVHALKQVGVPVIDDKRDSALMHNKFMVFDRRAVWTGSMNFTENCAYKNNNNGMYFDSVELAENYETKFSWMFDQHRFGSAPSKTSKIPHPIVKLSDGTMVENYFSTHDRLASHVIDAVGKARQSVHFLAFSYTHNAIAEAMLSRAHAGVQVQGVFEKGQTTGGYSEYAKLRAAGAPVQVYLDANPHNMHHKVIVIDTQVAIAGSFNFSENADKTNDENLVIIHNPNIAKQFEEEFQRVYGAAVSLDGRGAPAATTASWKR